MPVRIATLIATCLLLLASPAAAFGQGAGDDQYTDPFGDGQTEEPAGGGGSAPAEPESTPAPAPAPTAPAPEPDPAQESAPAPSAPAPAAAPAAQEREQLPYTGADAGLLAAGGLLLLGGGVALRVRLRAQQ